MSFITSLIRPSVCAALAGIALPGWTAGTQTGWCIGVGNKHSTSACTGGTPQLDTTPNQLPSVNQPPNTQTGPVHVPTPLVLTVPVGQPPTDVQLQRPDQPMLAIPQPQVVLQEILRPRPLQPTKPPQPQVVNTPGVMQGGNLVLAPQPQVPVVTVTPPQPLGTVLPQVTNQLVPLAQPPRPVVNPPQVVAIPTPGVVQGGTVVLTPKPQVPVVTVTPPQPLGTVLPQVTNQLVPLAQPPHPVVNPPQVVAIPTPGVAQGGNVVLTPQPQVPVVTVTPPQPPVVVPPQVTTLLVPVLPPKPPTTQVVPPRSPQPELVVSAHRPTDTPQAVPQGGVVQPQVTPHNGGSTWVVRLPGRQPAHALPTRIDVASGGAPVQCVVSGFGWRKQPQADGGWELIGFHPHLRTTDILVRDIPANRHTHAGCVLEVVRRQPVGM
ncbi:MAG: hypothetical protein Q8S02_00930 [Hydrogenophaga sp.]|nr:hypothetical protein [Hydrogenophaga sp.]